MKAGEWKEEMVKMDRTLDKMEAFDAAVSAAKARAELLSGAAIDAVPRTVDWRDALGEDMEGWRSYEAIDCGECKRQVVLGGVGESEHRDVQPSLEVPELVAGEDCICFECDHEFCLPGKPGEILDEVVCPRCEEEFSCGDEYDCTCDGYVISEGPMMNFFYPVDITDCELAAQQIEHLPLCVVEMRDGSTGLALTGGGMDMSDSICLAYMALGYLPPTHFAYLPRFAGYEKNPVMVDLLVACARSLDIKQVQAGRTKAYLTEMLDAIRDEAAKPDEESESEE